jgi:HicA toxin of bacterial toxin-antitoxin,
VDYSSRAVIKKIEADGWTLVNTTGSHKQFKHPHEAGPRDGPAPLQGSPDRYAGVD